MRGSLGLAPRKGV